MDVGTVIAQQGLGDVCFCAVPGMAGVEGRDVVVQIQQTAADGSLYQVGARSVPAALLFVALLIG